MKSGNGVWYRRDMAEPASEEPDAVTLCPIDGNPLTGRRRYCSDRCRQKAHRQRHAPEPVPAVPKDVTETREYRKTVWNARVAFRRWADRYRDRITDVDAVRIISEWMASSSEFAPLD